MPQEVLQGAVSKVLIIEDDDFYFDSLRRHFKKAGNQVFNTLSYSSATSALHNHLFELIIIDPGMPDFGALKEDDNTRMMIIKTIIHCSPSSLHLVITGRFSAREAETCRKMGVKGYLSKSRLNAPTLANIIDQMSNSDFVTHTGDEIFSNVIVTNPDLTIAEEECLLWVQQRPNFMKRKDLFALMAKHFGFKSPDIAEQKYKRARSKVLAKNHTSKIKPISPSAAKDISNA